ncbi:MAG: hypothetical protein Q4D04_13450 [Clostridia bacterium]|nr:hypothetical protein [Clostridia bacterium]
MSQWLKHMCAVYISVAGSGADDWLRIGKSTVFSVNFNPQVETTDYIEDEFPTDIVRRYNPSMDQEIAMIEGDDAFDALFAVRQALPTGTDANKRVLVVYPKDGTNGKVSFAATATIRFNSELFVDSKLTFTLGSLKDISWGETAFSNGKPSFTANS